MAETRFEIDWDVGPSGSAEPKLEPREMILKTDQPVPATIRVEVRRSLERFSAFSGSSPSQPVLRVLLTSHSHLDPNVRNAIADGRIQWLVSSVEEFLSLFEQRARHEADRLSGALRREVWRSQNKRLEDLSATLESRVADRTAYADQQRMAARDQSRAVRKLVLFTEQLIDAPSLDRFLEILDEEFRSLAPVQSPILMLTSWDGRPLRTSFQGRTLSLRQCRSLWPTGGMMRPATVDDIKYLRNEFSRPFGRVIVIPLHLTGLKIREGRDRPPILYIEHDLSDDEYHEFLRDITPRLEPAGLALEQILLDQQIQQTVKMWASTFQSLTEPMALIDHEYRVHSLNVPPAQGGPSAPCYEQIFSRSSPCEECPLQQTLSTRLPQSKTVRIEGDPRAMLQQVMSFPLQGSVQGSDHLAVHHYRNLTETKLLQSRLIQSEKMAELGRLAGHLAHELNNPLTGIKSMVQILGAKWSEQALRSLAPASLLEDLKEVETAASRCQAIVSNLMGFAQSSSVKNQHAVAVNSAVKETIPLLKAPLRDHSLDLDLSDEIPAVWAEKQLLQQVVYNLIQNACQSMPVSGRITVRSYRDGDHCVVEVHDTGVGITKDQMSRLFEPFFTTKAPGQGTGLGLSLSRSIIREFGGDIIVESSPGVGSVFKVVLPIFMEGAST